MNATLAQGFRGLARTLLITMVAVVAMGTLQAAPASAYTTRNSGNPGRVTGYQVQGSHYDSCTSPYYTCFTPWVVGHGPAVYRSPSSSGTQTITAVYQLQRYNGSYWVNYSSRVYTRYLQRGYSWMYLPRIDFLPNTAGSFRVVIGIAWSNQYDTVTFGAKKLVYNRSGDFICNTRFPCEAGAGYVWLRSPGV